MKFLPLLTTCARALLRNPMRATLTILGIVIGIAAVIAMMEIGNGSQQQIQATIASMGANTVTVRPSSSRTAGVATGVGGQITLVPRDAAAIARNCSNVVRTSIVVSANGQAVYGNNNYSPSQVQGVTTDYFKIRNWEDLQDGTLFTDDDVDKARRVCVIGTTIAKELFGGESPVGKQIRLKGVALTVTGVLKSKGSNMMGWDQDDIIVAPWTSIKYRIAGGGGTAVVSSSSSTTSSTSRSDTYPSTSVDYYSAADAVSSNDPHPRRFRNIDQILVEVKDPANSQAAVDEITELLRQRHKLGEEEEDDFRVWNSAEMSKVMSSTSEVMTNLLLVVAMISLVVGGVGIMNIMLVSVTERTREIGLRMAVGARPKDIMRQFLLESTLLCLVGGIFGILLGRGMSLGVAYFLKWPTLSSPSAMVLAFVVSASIGIIFGWYPSWKASNLDPIDALRHE